MALAISWAVCRNGPERDLRARARRYCVCELPYNPDAYMLQCEACEDWFHPQCIGYTQAQVEPIKSFACPECQQVCSPARGAG